MKNRLLYVVISCAHIAIALVAFAQFFLHPGKVVFCDTGDGLKNIFTYITYVKAPVTTDGIFKYDFFQYPFGDYVYYTDNNPLLALPLRWFCHHVYDISAHAIVLLQLSVVANIVLCGLLVFYIFRRLTGSDLVSFLLALVLPWCNMQMFRIPWGHFAFSYSSFVLIPVWLFMLWHRYTGNIRKQLLVLCGMCMFSFLGFLAQGYYLAIVTLFVASMMFVYGLYRFKNRSARWAIPAALIYATLAFALTIGIIALTDRYLPLRKEAANGYDWGNQKVQFSALFTHYNFQHIAFPLFGQRPRIVDPECAAYLGNTGLYAIVLVLLLCIVSKAWRMQTVASQKAFFGDPLKASIFFGSVVMLSISVGEHYHLDWPGKDGVTLTNVFNPLLYVHLFTKRVEQFRSIERFAWPFFFAFYLWTGFTLAWLAKSFGPRVKVGIAILIIVAGGAEVYDYTCLLRNMCSNNNPFSADRLAAVKPHIDLGQYQSILPLPYYYAGSEDYDVTLNDDDKWTTQNYQLSYSSALPLMACKMSRTPPVFNHMLMKWVTTDSMEPALKEKLGSKPILVAVNKVQLHDSTLHNVPDPGTKQAELYWNANLFAERNHLQAIDSVGDVVYYSFYKP